MAEATVSFVLQQLYQLVTEETTLLRRLDKDFTCIRDQLESIQAFLKDADRRCADEKAGAYEGEKAWVKQVREAFFHIEDVIDECTMYLAQRVHNSGCIASPQNIYHMIKTLKQRHVIASGIQGIKLSVHEINERSVRYGFHYENGPGSSRGNGTTTHATFGDPRMASVFIEGTQVVGFESQRDELVSFLVEGTNEHMLISVVGMGGLGKTTLANHVFNDQMVKQHFDCRSFITVSKTYIVRELLIDMIQKFCKDSNEPIPRGLKKMDDTALITQVREYLKSKRYLVFFDDVWKETFSDEIEHAMVNNDKGSRIIVTTRMMNVAEYFKKCFPVHIHELQPLSPEHAWELFCYKAFRSEPGWRCPEELKDMSKEVDNKCGGLPLAIVAIGGLLSTKPKTMFEWKKLSQNLRMELDRNEHLTSLRKILSLSYDDLPYHLKSCMLYFGVYPEDYTINRKRLTRQWMAEGFVKNEGTRTLEEFAEECLTQLIQRSLIHVSKLGFDGKVKSCQVHDMLQEVIIKKMEDWSFCQLIHEDDQQVKVGITRRFSIATISNNVLTSNGNKGIRAILVFDKGELPKHFVGKLSSKFKLLKVLDFQNSLLNHVPSNLGNLFHLRYLNLSHTKVKVLPSSIGKLLNLETLDLRQTRVHVLPREINKLTKLRLLPVYYRNYEGHYSMMNFTEGVKMHDGIGCLKSLQKLYFVEADEGGIDLIQELRMLRQLRKPGIRKVRREYGNALCDAIQEMEHLESLNITAIAQEEILDLDFISTPPHLRVLNLKGRLTKLPGWIPKLEYLVKLRLGLSNFEDDPLDSLKNLPNLLRLNMWDDAFAGEHLHFQGGFPKLKELDLTRLNRLSSISIDRGTLLGLEHFRFNNNPQLKVVPQDLQNLDNLQFLGFADMPTELVDSIDPEKGGPSHWIINHIPLVLIRQKVGTRFHDYELRPIPTLSNV